jgi:hypothetical protein
MALLQNTFEGQDDGTVITLANSGGGSGDAFNVVNATGTREFDDGIVLRGSRALLLGTNGSTSPYVGWNNSSWTPAATVYSRVYFRVSAIPTSSSTIMTFRGTDGTTAVIASDVRLTNLAKLAIRIPTTTQHTSLTTIEVNTWYRLEMRVEAASSTHTRARGRLFYGSNIEGSTPDEAWGNNTTFPGGDGAVGGLMSGWLGGPGVASNLSIDDLSFSDVDWIGSSAPPPAPLDTPVVTVTDETGPTTTSGTDGSITVTWPAITGATAYDAGIANGLSQTGGFTTVSSAATSPYTFTGLAAGNYTVAIRANP